jgi:hypothetical protein
MKSIHENESETIEFKTSVNDSGQTMGFDSIQDFS